MQNSNMQALSNAISIWRNVPNDKKEEHIKNLYKSQNVDYEQEKARIIEAIRNKDPRIMQIINNLQQFMI